MSEPVLRLTDIVASYGAIQALSGVSLLVGDGEIIALLGANGAGKSTTLRTISGLLHPSQGTITFQGQRIDRASAESIVRRGIAHVPEGRHIFPGLNVRDNLLLGCSNGRLPKGEVRAQLDQVMELFPDLRRLSKQLGWSLSGGQQQMLAIGRALMSKPALLLLDEPSLGLAPIIVQQVFSIIRDINRRGATVLLVEQNARMALSIAHRGYVLQTGQLVLEGPAGDLLQDEAVRLAYLREVG
ncbi:MAG: ABC transporter ATP-binding protein [Pseudomonadota bacterium]|nr:ABC transporter ATP-binding protein [Pseudomonadota bacterium]